MYHILRLHQDEGDEEAEEAPNCYGTGQQVRLWLRQWTVQLLPLLLFIRLPIDGVIFAVNDRNRRELLHELPRLLGLFPVFSQHHDLFGNDRNDMAAPPLFAHFI